MKSRSIATAILAVALSACATSTTTTLPTADTGSASLVATTTTLLAPDSESAPAVATTSPAHAPFWITVKYRSDPVDVADPRFTFLDGGSSSLVDAAFYDAGNEYMIISLEGTAYHYCGMPSSVWSSFAAASSLGSFYRSRIKGNFDCRRGFVPEY